MTQPTMKSLQAAWDRVLSTQSVAQSQIVDLYDRPWELLQAAEQVRLMDLALGNYVRLLAQAASILPEDAPTLDGLEAMLRWQSGVKQPEFTAVSDHFGE
jgi:hypothetical protein